MRSPWIAAVLSISIAGGAAGQVPYYSEKVGPWIVKGTLTEQDTKLICGMERDVSSGRFLNMSTMSGKSLETSSWVLVPTALPDGKIVTILISFDNGTN